MEADNGRGLGCESCGAPLAEDQRYCLECGARRGPLPFAIADRLAAVAGDEPLPAPPAAQDDAPQPIPCPRRAWRRSPSSACSGSGRDRRRRQAAAGRRCRLHAARRGTGGAGPGRAARRRGAAAGHADERPAGRCGGRRAGSATTTASTHLRSTGTTGTTGVDRLDAAGDQPRLRRDAVRPGLQPAVRRQPPPPRTSTSRCAGRAR